MQFSPVTSSLFDPNILLSTLFSNTLSLYSFLKVRDQVSHPYRNCVPQFRKAQINKSEIPVTEFGDVPSIFACNCALEDFLADKKNWMYAIPI
jgi:hypothetical protein